MSISSVSGTAPQLQTLMVAKAQQPKEGAEPPAAKALEGANDQMNAALAAISSGVDISV
jgi:hypothetical protein